ncbi:trypsin-like peptidase domain-containing protein [Aquisalimonas sp.]|uniref:S1C family serine protease n=2 Tax=Aquisalimonas TaxID=406099 RepID=UPI0025C44B70|nr:trypsin-like peptidase domain-containing protein [Aquisalimonas sp.]
MAPDTDMQTRRAMRFLLTYSLLGMVAAAMIIWFFPGVLGLPGEPLRTITVQQAPETAADDDGRPVREQGPASYADAVDAAAPAVVNIFTATRVARGEHSMYDDPLFREFFGERDRDDEQTDTNLGSGVIISDSGFILTSNHIVEGADAIQVSLNDGRAGEAQVVGTDPETDLAVLALDMDDLPVITVGRSEELRVGDVVLAIGNPFGVGQTVTQGIVSATGRSRLGLTTFENFIQTDAAINPGNSGGALINAHGDLIGINTAIFSRSGGSHGIGFAIPAMLAQGVMESIIEQGRVIRGWAGVEVQDITRSLAESFELDSQDGVLIAGVMRDGPADAAGLQPGDIVLSVDGERLRNSQDLLMRITERSPDTEVTIVGKRDGEEFERALTVQERPAARELRRQ